MCPASAVLVAALAVLLFRCHARRGDSGDPSPPQTPPRFLRQFSYAQLRRATAFFAHSHFLGHGGFGPVFRVALPSGEEFAVKVMDSCDSLRGEREFLNELALAARFLSVPSAASAVVPAIGFCVVDGDREHRRRWWRWWRREDAVDALEAVGASPRRRQQRKLILVYDLMRKGSLQDALLERRCPEMMNWARRFAVVRDVVRGLHFLHAACDPPVIHGDIKPSNILLDDRLAAKIADFGLARLHRVPLSASEDETLGISVAKTGESATSTETGFEDVEAYGASDTSAASPATTVEPASASEVEALLDSVSIDEEMGEAIPGSEDGSRKKKIGAFPGRDWWWKQKSKSVSCDRAEDYLTEWIQSETKKEAPTWESDDQATGKKNKKNIIRRGAEWWASLYQEWWLKRGNKSRPTREWWREEFYEELLLRRHKPKPEAFTKSKSTNYGSREQLRRWQNDEHSTSPLQKRRRSKKNHNQCRDPGRRVNSWIDQFSGEINTVERSQRRSSSTLSRRGTLCYLAPEHSGSSGMLTEKCDIYSFGVLLLVIVSGRRPLQVMASVAASDRERANLMSWAKYLARSGRLLDLVDPGLCAVDMEQALLCVKVALLCLQKTPSARPTSEEILSMLNGESEPPILPLEFSPPTRIIGE
ncbi:receptor-like serine/threonine-protein kinase At4g25390 [Zingiber officinale]|nr:receptor-like serine/threonine-protein kinase At4g25390 [Zingiber officinale]